VGEERRERNAGDSEGSGRDREGRIEKIMGSKKEGKEEMNIFQYHFSGASAPMHWARCRGHAARIIYRTVATLVVVCGPGGRRSMRD